MIRLIVNADDLGSGQATDRGIFRCYTHGILTSASLLANGRSFVEAARETRALGLPVGVHFNISEGRSLSGPIPGLTTSAGDFFGKTLTRRALVGGAFSARGLERELTAQITRALDADLVLDHADSHQHACLFGAAGATMIKVLRRFGLSRVRLPMPEGSAPENPAEDLRRELRLYRALAPRFRELCRKADLSFPNGLWGMPWLNRLDDQGLLHLLDHLPAGCGELMMHPGDLDPHNPFSGPERVREQQALCHPAVVRRIEERGIALINFGDLC